MSKGRGNGNSITTMEAVKLEINYLIRNKQVQTDKEIIFRVSWANNVSVNAILASNKKNIYLRLMYSVINTTTNEIKQIDYKIHIVTVKSNLGVGSNLYFICPESGMRCKILYLCYGSEMFKCRKAYKKRIYYPTQIATKEYRLNSRFFNLERKINRLKEKRSAINYKGKPTKRKTNLFILSFKRDYINELRCKQLAIEFGKLTGRNL